MGKPMENLYKNRPLSEGYPALRDLGVEYFKTRLEFPGREEVDREGVTIMLGCLENLIDLTVGPRTVLVVGCGPRPIAIKMLLEHGYDAIGIDVLDGFVDAAREFLQDETLVYHGKAESLPFDSNSKRIIVMESLLEHVDSPIMCLSEAYRVLEPG